jgi:hypothetical protein
MHSHGNPKGRDGKILLAGQLCKIGESNSSIGQTADARHPVAIVVWARARTYPP